MTGPLEPEFFTQNQYKRFLFPFLNLYQFLSLRRTGDLTLSHNNFEFKAQLQAGIKDTKEYSAAFINASVNVFFVFFLYANSVSTGLFL